VATLNTTSKYTFAQVREQFRAAVERTDHLLPPTVAQAMQSVVAALEYEDRPLIRSHLETAIAALSEAVGDDVNKQLTGSQSVRVAVHRLTTEVGVRPSEEFDQVGKTVALAIGNFTRILTEASSLAVRLKRAGADAPWEDAVRTELQELEALRVSLVGGWPWSHLPLPASDAAMLARSRDQATRGEGVPLDELIRQIESEK